MNSLQPSDFADKLSQRRKYARHTLRQTPRQELHELVRALFPDGTHPWAAEFSKFIEKHRTEFRVRGETSDGFGLVYYPRSRCGIWYKYIRKFTGQEDYWDHPSFTRSAKSSLNLGEPR